MENSASNSVRNVREDVDASVGDDCVVGTILSEAHARLPDGTEDGLLQAAVLKGQHKAIIDLLQNGYSVNHNLQNYLTPLMIACSCKSAKSVDILLKHGADPLLMDKLAGETALDYLMRPISMTRAIDRVTVHLAYRLFAHIPDNQLSKLEDKYKYLIDWLVWSKEHQDYVLLEEFVKRGVNVDVRIDDESLLHSAVCFAEYKTVKLLLDHGANINSINSRYETPLHRCVQVIDTKKRLPIVSLLLDSGAILHTVNRHGDSLIVSALFTNIGYNISEDRQHLLNTLITHGCDLWFNDRLDSTLRMYMWPMDSALNVYITALKAGFNARKLGHTNGLSQLLLTKKDSISPSHSEYVQFYLDNPIMPLQYTCAVYIRRLLSVHGLGKSIMKAIESLPLPPILIDYMKLKT